MLVMNPDDGEILAMVGSADYNNAAIRGQVNLTGVDPLGLARRRIVVQGLHVRRRAARPAW